MATKRDIAAVTESETEDSPPQSSNKRQRNQPRKSKQSAPATDLTYGQQSCFPGLDDGTVTSDEDLDIEDDQDALSYLNSVRQEANGIPHLLVAPKSGPQLPSSDDMDHEDSSSTLGGFDHSIYENGVGDVRGYYHDGAYTAAPAKTESASDATGHEPDTINDEQREAEKVTQAYFDSMAAHFTSLRECLHQTPPPEAVQALSREQSPYVGNFGPRSRTFVVWSTRFRYADPLPAQVAAMDKGSVFRLLRVMLGGKFLRRGTDLRERTSRWLWALLARLPDRGELDSGDISHVRELGKRAALLMHTLQEMAALREEVELGMHDEGVEDEVWDDDLLLADDVEQADTAATDVPEESEPGPKGEIQETATTADKPQGQQDVELEDGEVPDDPAPTNSDADIAAAKARLLAQLDSPVNIEPEVPEAQTKGSDEEAYDPIRARMNMRATLNMILTVAGEFYGQRDLLEFRAPFNGL